MFLPSVIFSLCVSAALWLLIRRHPARDPRLLGVAMTLLVLLPLLHFAPKFSIAVSATPTGPPSTSWLLTLWFTGLLFFGVRMFSDFLALARWKRRSLPCQLDTAISKIHHQLGFNQKVNLRLHPDLASPVVAGLFSPTIYLPLSCHQWSQKTLHMALLHECSHLQRRDLWLASLASFACLLHWFNPAVWWMRRVLLTQCEYACDAHLLSHGADPATYAHALCDVAQSSDHPRLALAMAGHVPLRQRIQNITSPEQHRSLIILAFLLITSASAIAMSLIRLTPEALPSYPASEIELRFSASPFPGDE
ncbi:MAG: M56 family metallopeptidase [Verrucomicrobiaceae bacterium]